MSGNRKAEVDFQDETQNDIQDELVSDEPAKDTKKNFKKKSGKNPEADSGSEAAPASSESEAVFLIKRLQQQLTFIEKKIDALANAAPQRPSSEKHFSRPFRPGGGGGRSSFRPRWRDGGGPQGDRGDRGGNQGERNFGNSSSSSFNSSRGGQGGQGGYGGGGGFNRKKKRPFRPRTNRD